MEPTIIVNLGPLVSKSPTVRLPPYKSFVATENEWSMITDIVGKGRGVTLLVVTEVQITVHKDSSHCVRGRQLLVTRSRN